MGKDCFKDALQIVDFYHALVPAGEVLQALLGKDHPDYEKRRRQWAKQLLQDKVQKLIDQTRKEGAGQPQAAAVEEALGYFVRNVSRMQYGTFRAADLAQLLAEYEAQRDKYPTLDSFAPRLAEFFTKYAEDFDRQQTALASKRPKVVSMTPANGAKDVSADLAEIKVVFDRPMRDGSWAMCGGGPHYPETSGKPKYDPARTTWTVPVKLKPDWSYEFWLNSGKFDAFRSAEGVPLDSVHVTFKTAAKPLK